MLTEPELKAAFEAPASGVMGAPAIGRLHVGSPSERPHLDPCRLACTNNFPFVIGKPINTKYYPPSGGGAARAERPHAVKRMAQGWAVSLALLVIGLRLKTARTWLAAELFLGGVRMSFRCASFGHHNAV